MTEEPIQEDPVQKFRKLIASFIPLARQPKKEVAMEQGSQQPPANAAKKSALDALPRKKDAEKAPSAPIPAVAPLSAPKPAATSKAAPTPKMDSSPAPETGKPSKFSPGLKGGFSIGGPRLWTTASVLSLTINILLTIVLLILIVSVYRLKLDMAKIMNASAALMDLPGGLYSNFELMERASIQTNVVVNTSIPVTFDLPLNQSTNVALSQDVTITNARVTIKSDVLNITQANTTIILPQGTILPITLNLTVPVDQQVPVTLNVPVDIPLNETQLNDPFVGLQKVIEPLYCLLEPEAVNIDGQPICP